MTDARWAVLGTHCLTHSSSQRWITGGWENRQNEIGYFSFSHGTPKNLTKNHRDSFAAIHLKDIALICIALLKLLEMRGHGIKRGEQDEGE